MHRIDSATAEADKFGAGKNGYTEGTPGVLSPTETTADHINAFQEELIAPIEALGTTLVKATNTQLLTAIKRMLGTLCLSNWTERANPKNFQLWGVAYGNGVFCAVGGADGADAYIVTSENLSTWTEQANPKNVILYAVASNGTNLFVAVGNTDGADAYIVTSTTGAAPWTEQATPKNFTLNGVAYNGSNLWAAVGNNDGVDSFIVTSPNGAAPWTERAPTVAKTVSLRAVAFGGAVWVAVGDASGGGAEDAYILTSPDGTTWTERANPQNGRGLTAVAYDGVSRWVAVGENVGQAYVVYSDDSGATWTQTTTGVPAATLYAVTYTNSGMWVAVGNRLSATNSPVVLTSPNGITWTRRYGPSIVDLCAIATNTVGRVVAVGEADGTDACINQSLNLPFSI